ncbi:DUF4350 domain-containing protein [Stutzerimonas nosocomialis]|uniref:DUF4350 domain-containing protein n=1 Tax=Stutzerimonas nosocomialis TaxID=1056496 RepID=UPI0011096547|nr:DUF4350 domain-containing protein [Stutzerimonas nosocomialis]TLX54616.1 DUF4350 domain-containing protein [Stutzerimonas nosocomialis]
MTVRIKLTLALAAAVLVALLGYYLQGRLQPYEEIIEHGPAPEARANPYLAAEAFLRERGITTRRNDDLEAVRGLTGPGNTLMLLGDRSRMSPRQSRQLLEWAASGGHLVFVAERLWDEDDGRSGDLLLDSLELEQYETDELSAEDAGKVDDAEAAEPYPELTKLYLENEQAPAYVAFDTAYHLYDAGNRAHAWANSAAATHMLQLQHGDGLVTVLTDAWIWQNRKIGQYDHAWLLWYLTQDSAVTLIYRADHESLARLLLEHFPEALTALLLMLALLLWHHAQRQGPIQIPPSPARRQLQEHLRGTADFLLRRSGPQRLLLGLQKDIQRRARHRHPGFERLPVAEQWQVLGRLSRLPVNAISQAMRPLPAERIRPLDFTRQVAHLQNLRNAL